MKTFTIGWLNKCRCGNKSHAVKTARGNESALWDDDAVKCNSCGRGGVIQVCEGQARVLWETDEEMAEGKPMSTLTKEWLHQTIAELEEERDATPGAVNEDAAMALEAMKLALASLEAKDKIPELRQVIYHFRDWNEGFPVERFKADYVISWMLANYPPAQPTAVSVPGDVSGPLAHAYKELTPTFMRNHIDVFERYGIYPDGSAGIQAMRIALDGMNRRAAMLQGADGI